MIAVWEAQTTKEKRAALDSSAALFQAIHQEDADT